MNIVVIGAGIMGLATAWAVRKLGHDVILADQGPLPNPLAASSDRSRAIRFAYGEMHGYSAMVAEAYDAWERLWSDLGGTHYVETGHLLLGPKNDPWIMNSLAAMRRLGIPCEGLEGAHLHERFPILDEGIRHGWFAGRAGILFPDRIAHDLLAWLQRDGADLLSHFRAVEVDDVGGTVRAEDGRRCSGDAILLAGGAWAGRLLPDLWNIVQPSRQVVIYMQPPSYLAEAWDSAPFLSNVDSDEGKFFYALPPAEGVPLKFGDHRPVMTGDLDEPRVLEEGDIAPILGLGRATLGRLDDYGVESTKVCFYTMSADERFVAGRRNRLHYLSACSGHGFKFGATIGEHTAQLLTQALPFPAYHLWLSGRT